MTAFSWGYGLADGTGVDALLGQTAAATAYAPQTMAGPVEMVGAAPHIAIGIDQHLYWFGQNRFGIAWNGSAGDFSANSVPQLASSVSGTLFTQVGYTFTATANGVYALDVAGNLWVCGTEFYGNFGLGSPTLNNYSGVQTIGNVVDFAVGGDHAVVFCADGTVRTTGRNANGQLGNGTTTDKSTWTIVTPATGTVIGIAAGYAHTLCLMADGTVKGVGDGSRGKLGPSASSAQTTWIDIGFTGVAKIGASESFYFDGGVEGQSLAILNDGSLWGIGSSSVYGGLGINAAAGNPSTNSAPVSIPLPVGVLAVTLARVSAGASTQGVIGSDGLLYLWGLNDNGTMGVNDTSLSTYLTPTAANGLTNVNWVHSYGQGGAVYAGHRGPTARGYSFASILG